MTEDASLRKWHLASVVGAEETGRRGDEVRPEQSPRPQGGVDGRGKELPSASVAFEAGSKTY